MTRDEDPGQMLNRFMREAVDNHYRPLWTAIDEMWADLTDEQRDRLKPLMRDGVGRFGAGDDIPASDGGHDDCDHEWGRWASDTGVTCRWCQRTKDDI